MQIHFQVDRRREIAAWRGIYWGAERFYIGWLFAIGIFLAAGAMKLEIAWLWIGVAGAALLLLWFGCSLIRSPYYFVRQNGETVSISVDETGLSFLTADERIEVGWEAVNGINRFGDFLLFDCGNSTIGAQLIPFESLDGEKFDELQACIHSKSKEKDPYQDAAPNP